MRRSPLIVAAFLAVCASAAPAPLPQRSAKILASTKGGYTIPNVGTFNNRKTWNFSKLSDGSNIPDGLRASSYPVGDNYVFVPQNAYIAGGYLNLKVDGGQKAKPYRSGEVVTTATNIKYASVRTVAIFSEPPGVCNGMFFYKDDNQETDIEWLSDPASQSNAGKRQLWFANQASNVRSQKSVKGVPPPANPTVTEHEYRIDWVPGAVRFFVDGAQIWESKQNVPNVPGPWVFNNWADGDKGWSGGPPAKDAIFRIKEIDMYYNTA
ncbi:glycoside hydrolase family 16 protein [Colletotrichum incanum]|uniref:Glycoside hydrolase family 16 protein n=1 Tax=Colletotrichum incanum TaxID=1573173 RepID=A0A167C1W6_COLIC|nr:glycoside hydrolase family 16 protein [Colletotrichum incanum]